MTHTASDTPTVTLSSPADLVAATPYLLGFHPAHSVVVVAFRRKQLVFAVRGDLPGPGEPPADTVHDLLEMVVRQDADAVAILGYGEAGDLDHLLSMLHQAAQRHELFVKDVLRVHEGRWWSAICEDPGCCPPEGTPIDVAAHPVSARFAFEGLAAAPSREHRAHEVAPVTGPDRLAMSQAADRAERRLGDLFRARPVGGWEPAMLAEGTVAVEAAITRYAEGGQLDDDELAWLGVLLDAVAVRDVAWRAIATEQPHLRLWSDVTRRVDPALAAPPAALLAFTAWRFGDGVLAGLALERALLADPSYSLAHLLLEGLRRGEPPETLAAWGTPEWERQLDRDLRRLRRQTGRRRRKSRAHSPAGKSSPIDNV